MVSERVWTFKDADAAEQVFTMMSVGVKSCTEIESNGTHFDMSILSFIQNDDQEYSSIKLTEKDASPPLTIDLSVMRSGKAIGLYGFATKSGAADGATKAAVLAALAKFGEAGTASS